MTAFAPQDVPAEMVEAAALELCAADRQSVEGWDVMADHWRRLARRVLAEALSVCQVTPWGPTEMPSPDGEHRKYTRLCVITPYEEVRDA